MVVFLASLRSVDGALLESADMDGAGWWKKNMRITIPIISPIILTYLVKGLISAFQVFTQVYILTSGNGHTIGGDNQSAYVYMFNIFHQAYQEFRIGYSSALAWFMWLLLALIVFVVTRICGGLVFYSYENKG